MIKLWKIEMVGKVSGHASVRYRTNKHEALSRKARATKEGRLAWIEQVAIPTDKFALCDFLNTLQADKDGSDEQGELREKEVGAAG